MKVARKNTDHVVGNGAGGKCLHCGATIELKLPVEVTDFCNALDSFVKRHAHCKPPTKSRKAKS
jgi:hypothetical protein